jgi:hypothetical protein
MSNSPITHLHTSAVSRGSNRGDDVLGSAPLSRHLQYLSDKQSQKMGIRLTHHIPICCGFVEKAAICSTRASAIRHHFSEPDAVADRRI